MCTKYKLICTVASGKVSKLVTNHLFKNRNIETHMCIDIAYFSFVHCLYDFELSLNLLLPISEVNLISVISYTRKYSDWMPEEVSAYCVISKYKL